MFANLHLYEIILIVVIIVIVFGGKRLPELGKGLGKGLRNFRKGLSGQEDSPEDSGPKDRPSQPSDPAKNNSDKPKA
ncbi:MAG: twin-arginine translocase TatA/TatE family subunit [Deltaproteobacteria bacterium]|nr:twin-arginine translocase TatA/TatE family subunit [Deltaproteobacteria bacterium]